MGNIRLDNSYIPKVGAQFVPQPSIPAGTGQALPREIGQVAGALDNLRQVEKGNEDKEQSFEEQKAYLDEATALPDVLQKAQNAAPENAIDFQKTTNELLKKRHDDILASYAGKLTPEALQNLDLKFTDLRRSASAASTKFATDSHNSYLSVQTGDAADKLGKLVFSQPEMLDSSLQEFKKLVDSLPELDAPTKEKLYSDTRTQMALLAGMGYAERDPKAVVGALTPGGRTYGATPTRVALINSTWTAAGVPAQWGFDFAKLESDVGRNQATSGEDNQGLFQLGPEERKGSAGSDEATNSKLAAELTARNIQTFKAKFNRMPTETEAYLMHQQGTAGGLAIAGAPNDKPAWEVLRPFYPSTRSDAYVKTAVAQGGILSPDATVGQVKALWASKIGDTGNLVLDHLNGPQQMQVLNAAQSNVARIQTQDRTQLTIDTTNATQAFLSTGSYAGNLPTQERFVAAYGDADGAQRWADFQGIVRQGQFIKDSGTMSETEMATKLETMRPKDTSSSTYSADQQSYADSVKARDTILSQRKSDSAAYVMQHYPAVQVAFDAMTKKSSGETKQAFYASMAQAYDQLGIPQADRKVFPAGAAASLKDQLAKASPEERVALLGGLKSDTGALFPNALDQLAKEGKYREAYIADAVNFAPNMVQTFADALRGLDRIEGPNKVNAEVPNQTVIDNAFGAALGAKTMRSMDPAALRAMEDLVTGLYIERGGAIPRSTTDSVDSSFGAAVRQIVGGTISGDTGIITGANDPSYKTILPPNINQAQWNAALQKADGAFWVRNSESGGPPTWAGGDIPTPQEILDEGTFVRVGSDSYIIRMKSNGQPLMDPQSKSVNPYYVVHLGEDTVRGRAEGTDKEIPRAPLGPKGGPDSLPSVPGIKALNLTPEEQFYYDHHRQNLFNQDIVKNADGSISTMGQITVEADGRFYNLPTVWNGKIVSKDTAIKLSRAASSGNLSKWPSYPTEVQAQTRADQIHVEIAKDVRPVGGYKGLTPDAIDKIMASPEYKDLPPSVKEGLRKSLSEAGQVK